jgi:hypothetical protein
MGVPFATTSNRPPRDGISSTCAPGMRCSISAASLAARGS